MSDLFDPNTTIAPPAADLSATDDNVELPKNEDNADLPDELTLLKERATLMGITFHPAIGAVSLAAKIAAALNVPPPVKDDVTPPVVVAAAPLVADGETEAARNQRLRKEAVRLVRVNITCMNPNKKDWPGEFKSVGNSVVGMVKKYIPFNTSEGYHVPSIILEHLKECQCQIFYPVVLPNGQKVQKGKLIKEFAIDILPNLTPVEITELARMQAINNSIE